MTLNWEDPLEKGVATHSSILSWRIPWTEEVYKLLSIDNYYLFVSYITLSSPIHQF